MRNLNNSKASLIARASIRISAMLLAFLAIGTPSLAAQVVDARGRTVEVRDTSRIVAIGGSVTEILFALGLGGRVIAVDQTSRYPAAARALPSVGYSRTLAPEGVLSVAPSVILALEGAGPRSALDVLENASVPVVIIPDAQDAAGVVRKIEAVAAAVGEGEKGEALAAAVEADFAALARAVAALEQHPRAVFVLSIGNGSAVVGGAGTSADAMFHLAGATNAMAALSGYKPAVDEAAMAADPEVVVVMRGGGQVLDAASVLALPAFAGTPAARHSRFVSLPGSYLLGFGPRAPQAARDLALALHGEAAIPALPPRLWAAEADE